ncbi:hypothetical protein CJU89_1718 [Yarrowia sp. B02]|nr:hypothetical protein CJU89_1718 [Yarrowia sp. B02]
MLSLIQSLRPTVAMNNVASIFVRNTCKSAHVKTKKAVANRIKICGSGKITRGKTGRKHGNTGWSAALLRKKTGMTELTGFQKKHVKKYVPFKQSP